MFQRKNVEREVLKKEKFGGKGVHKQNAEEGATHAGKGRDA